MAMQFWSFCVLTLTIGLVDGLKIRIVTWNVENNYWAPNKEGYTDASIDQVLGLNGNERFPMYAVGLQENCWKCSQGKLELIGEKFVARLNVKTNVKYKVVGVHGVRQKLACGMLCTLGNGKYHGNTIVMLLAKRSSTVLPKILFRHHKGCSSQSSEDAKGITVLKVRIVIGNTIKTLCIGSGHLDSQKSSYRRKCLKEFFEHANSEISWTNTCDAQFLFGDFNTRTGPKDDSKPKDGKPVPKNTNFTSLKQKDELTGITPFGNDNSNLLTYINSVQTKTFKEAPVTFMPTYSLISPKKYCKTPPLQANEYCYRTNRPESWTDRIIFTSGTCTKYDAVLTQNYGDHFPVFADFTM